jgi:hypothetical protein
MAAMSGGTMYLFSGALIVGVASSAILLHFAQREVNWFSFLTSLLGFVLSFGIIALVPYDVWEALSLEEAQELGNDDKVLVDSSWELIYWATFILCWLLCPILIEYEAAGDFTTLGRLRTSLRRNAVWYAGYLLFGSLVLIWLSIGGGAHGGLSAWCIAASNAWGLLVSTMLMGYGLVAVPRHFWRLASPSDQLRTLYCAAVSMDEARLSTQFELQDVIGEARIEILSRSSTIGDSKLERAFSILQQTLEECEQLHCELTNGARAPREAAPGSSVRTAGPDSTRIECLAQIHHALKQAGLEARRAACRWEELAQRCLLLEDLEEQMYPSAVELATSWQDAECPCARILCRIPAVRQCWHTLLLMWLRPLRPRVLRIAGGLCGCLSVVIVLGQLTMFSDSWSLSLLSLLFRREHGFELTQVLCILPLTYMVCTAYWSVFRLKITGWYGLYSNHNTDTGSLLWCASLLARLAAPLCYHFLLLVRVRGTAFQAMMGQMNVVPVLGRSFNEIFPCLVGFLCLCNLLNVYSRFVQLCGLDSLEFELAPSANSPAPDDVLAEGRRLIERERRRRIEDRSLMEMQDGQMPGCSIPLRVQIARLIEDGTLPRDWNAHSQ